MDILIISTFGCYVQVLVRTYIFHFGDIPRNGIAGSYSNYVSLFKKLPNCFIKGMQHFTFLPFVFKSSV